MSELSICLPHNPDGGQRDRIVAWVERYWRARLPEAEIVIGGPGGRRAWAQNRNWVARQARGEMLAIFDADVIAPPDTVRELARRCARSGMVGKFLRHAWIPQERTSWFLAQDPATCPFPQDPDLTHTSQGHPGFEFIMRRETFETCGGFGEEFLGWGGEDTSFMIVAATLAGICWSRERSVHLWHPPAPGGKTNKRDPSYLRNRRLGAEYGKRLGQPEAMRNYLRARPRT